MKTKIQENAQKMLEDAKAELYQLNLRDSFDLTKRSIEEDPTLVEGYRFLSYLYYHFEMDYKTAHELTQKALEISKEDWKTYKLKGVIYQEERNYQRAIEWYEKALLKLSYEDSEILALIGECYSQLNNENMAKCFMEKAIVRDPFCIKANRTLRVLYLYGGEYRRALKLYKMDNLIEDGEEIQGTISDVIDNIEKCIMKIEFNSEDVETLSDLGKSYSDGGLHEDALIIYRKALSMDLDSLVLTERVKKLEQYFEILKELNYSTIQIYIQTIHGERRNKKKHRGKLYSILIKIAPYFNELNKLPSKFNKRGWKKLVKFYRKEFKLDIQDYFHRKDSYGIYASYILNKIDFKAEHWGKQGNLEYIDLSRDVTVEFSTWVLTYFGGGIGGWTNIYEKNIIYQVSDSFKSINKYWDVISKPILLNEWLQKGEDDSCNDKYSLYDVYYAEGLSSRFHLKYMNDIYNESKAKYSLEEEQQKYFLKEYYRCKNQTLLFTHEFQHAIDIKSSINYFKVLLYCFRKRITGYLATFEYRAKLSELYYGENPYISMSIMMCRNIGGNSPHGKANTKIFKMFVEYVHNHAEDFPNIDTSINILLQLDKLEIDQIRTISKYAFE